MVAGAVGASERRSIEACGADGHASRSCWCSPAVAAAASPRARPCARLAGRPDLRPRADAQRPDRDRQRLAGRRERPAAAGRGRALRARRTGRGARVRRRGPRARGARAPRRGRAAGDPPRRPPTCRAVRQRPPLHAGPADAGTRAATGLPATAVEGPAAHAVAPRYRRRAEPAAAAAQRRVRGPAGDRLRRGRRHRAHRRRAGPPRALWARRPHDRGAHLDHDPASGRRRVARTVYVSRFARGWRAWRVTS